MRKLIGPVLFGVLVAGFAGAANAQQNPWVPSDVYTGKVYNGSLPNGVPADQNPWVPSDVYTGKVNTGNLPNGAPAWASTRPAHSDSKRHTTESK